jgi:eukaryotic-like serine/threonine-protein kinase
MTTRPEVAPTSAGPLPGVEETLVGKRVNKYEIVRVIGRGGMGTVYEALNTAIGKRVAMKFVDADVTKNHDAVARFQREAQAASAVESAHIVEIFDSGISEDGRPYIVMELLRGEDLSHLIKRCGRLDVAEAIHVTAQILRGLHRAHQAGIVHRDLKPDNIFLVDRDDDPNFAKILDFGISKMRREGDTPVHTLTRQGTVLGTPFYMSPEQAQAQPDVDGRTDLWAVGAILYECLTGRPPYTGTTYEQVIVNICMNDADDVRVHNPGVPEPLAAVIARALERDRDQRFQTAREFLDAMRGIASPRSGSLSDESFPGVSSSDPAFMPVSSRVTPSRPITSSGRKPFPSARPAGTAEAAFEPTVELPSSPPGGRPSPHILSAAERRTAFARKQRRLFAIVALTALFAGGFGAFVFARAFVHPVSDGGPPQRLGARPPVEASIGPAPTPPTQTVASLPIPDPPATVTTSQGDPCDTKRTQKLVHPPLVGPGIATSTRAPKPPDSAEPANSGVAPGLHLKTN